MVAFTIQLITLHATVYHLTLLLELARQIQLISHSFKKNFSQVRNKITENSSSQRAVVHSGCSIRTNRAWEQRLSLLVTFSKGRYFQEDRYFRGSVGRQKINVTFGSRYFFFKWGWGRALLSEFSGIMFITPQTFLATRTVFKIDVPHLI